MALRPLIVYGTRPEAVKLAPLIRTLSEADDFEPIVAVTGQHRAMLDQVNSLFGISPQLDLSVMRPAQSLHGVTAAMLAGLERELDLLRPDLVVVQGDTTTTFTASLAAFYAGIPVVHVEAGLRSGDMSAPFPEEANRRMTSVLASLHLAPTSRAAENLLREAVPEDAIVVTGNTVVDALQIVREATAEYESAELRALEASGRRVVLVTAHRRESWGSGMDGIGNAVSRLARRHDDVSFVLPLHKNPVVRDSLCKALGAVENVLLTEPLAYTDFVRVMAGADLILTDSGGVQEEAPGLGTPVLVLRDVTERIEAVEAGVARLVGTEPHAIVEAASNVLEDRAVAASMTVAENPFGDGRASERSVAAMRWLFGSGLRPEDFGAADAALIVD